MAQDSSPEAPRRRPPLTREAIAGAALALIDEHGIEGLSMRRLGARLGVEAMALYRHVDGRGGVLEAVADLLLAEIGEEPAPSGDWREVLSRFARRYRRVVLAHANAAALLSGRRERSYLVSRDSAEAVLAHLVECGFSPEDAIRAVRLVARAVMGFSLDERPALGGGDRDRDPADDLPADGYPLLRGLLADLRRPDRGDEDLFEFGLAVMLDGLEARRGGASA